MDHDLREEIKAMIGSEVGIFHAQNLNRFGILERNTSELRARIIGIDGNGTGREGALQRQDKVLAELKSGLDCLTHSVSILVQRDTSWDKKEVKKAMRWLIGTLLALATVIILYLTLKAIMHPTTPLLSNGPHISQHSTMSEMR